MGKACKNCVYFPCTKAQCWIDKEGCNDFESIVQDTIRKIGERNCKNE